jgi:hypothetical protein
MAFVTGVGRDFRDESPGDEASGGYCTKDPLERYAGQEASDGFEPSIASCSPPQQPEETTEDTTDRENTERLVRLHAALLM